MVARPFPLATLVRPRCNTLLTYCDHRFRPRSHGAHRSTGRPCQLDFCRVDERGSPWSGIAKSSRKGFGSPWKRAFDSDVSAGPDPFPCTRPRLFCLSQVCSLCHVCPRFRQTLGRPVMMSVPAPPHSACLLVKRARRTSSWPEVCLTIVAVYGAAAE